MIDETQRIIWYDPLNYQRLDADILTYAEFCAAFDAVAANCCASGQAFEKVRIDIPTMQRWLSENDYINNNEGRSAYAQTLNAVHPDIDADSETKEQTKRELESRAKWRRQHYFNEQYRADNFIGPGGTINWQFAPRSTDPTRSRG